MPDTANPYERRDRRDGTARIASTLNADQHERSFDRPNEVDHRGLTLADLDHLVRLKVDKARRDGDDAAYYREHANRPELLRKAWDEGHEAGHHAGWVELVAVIGRRFETATTGLRRDLAEFYETLDPAASWDKDTKVRAATLIRRAQTQLGQLIDAHHTGFEEVPF
jgi:hypothetical protein